MPSRLGKRTIIFENKPRVLGYAAVVGSKEGQGPLSAEFDNIYEDASMGLKSFEKAESELQRMAVLAALKKAKLNPENIDCIFAGDLLNQCIGSSFGIMDLCIPFVGLYGACSTMALSLLNAATYVDSGAATHAVAVTSSHFCSAERQYRFPLEYGAQRPPTAQWTVTGSGSVVLGQGEKRPYVHSATIGLVCDLGVKDANNMGAAMAPAAYDTILAYLTDTNTKPQDYDAIFTGDLGLVGSELLYELMSRDGVDLKTKHKDCGLMIYDRKRQDTHSGGSGCGCGASVLCSHILKRLEKGVFKNILFCATGALLSPTSTQQGNNIPVIAHAVNLRVDGKS